MLIFTGDITPIFLAQHFRATMVPLNPHSLTIQQFQLLSNCHKMFHADEWLIETCSLLCNQLRNKPKLDIMLSQHLEQHNFVDIQYMINLNMDIET
jgi:hypothetical protein